MKIIQTFQVSWPLINANLVKPVKKVYLILSKHPITSIFSLDVGNSENLFTRITTALIKQCSIFSFYHSIISMHMLCKQRRVGDHLNF